MLWSGEAMFLSSSLFCALSSDRKGPLFKSPAEKVTLLRWHSRHPSGHLHHLFLIQENASSLGQYPVQETIPGDGPPLFLGACLTTIVDLTSSSMSSSVDAFSKRGWLVAYEFQGVLCLRGMLLYSGPFNAQVSLCYGRGISSTSSRAQRFLPGAFPLF